MATNQNAWAGKYVLGIDLGTTKSVMSLWNPDSETVIVLRNAEGEERTPSVVAWDRTSRTWRVGTPALEIGKQFPQDMVYSVKRLMGRWYNDPVVQDWKEKLSYKDNIRSGPLSSDADKDKTPVEIVIGEDSEGTPFNLQAKQISALILGKLRQDAQQRLLEDGVQQDKAIIEYAVITVPAYFNEQQRADTREAAGLAGLAVTLLTDPSGGFVDTRLLEEPTAAALAYKSVIKEEEQLFLVYDLGGGTFDISILRCWKEDWRGYQMYVECVDGNTDLGGDHIDRELIQQAKIELEKRYPGLRLDLGDNIVHERLRQALEKAKRDLNLEDVDAPREISLTFSASDLGIETADLYEFTLTNDLVNECADETINKTIEILRTCLEEEGYTYDDIHTIVLVGGPTQMRYLRERLAEETGKRLNDDLLAHSKPQLVVGQGAGEGVPIVAVPDSKLARQTNLIRIFPQTLYIQGWSDDNIIAYQPVIERGKVFGTAGECRVWTSYEGQHWVSIPIVQSTRAQENMNPKEYTPINQVEREILPAEKNKPAELNVKFEVEKDGRFFVTVTDLRDGTSKKQEVTVHTKMVLNKEGK